jgi:hypothetical protein
MVPRGEQPRTTSALVSRQDRWMRPSIDAVDQLDATHYPTRNVSDTGWNHPHSTDTAVDVTAGERTRTDSADSPATAS